MEDIAKDTLIQAKEGSMEAFEKIYRAASDYIYNIALRITNNREDAEEATQDVFLKVRKNLIGFRFRSSFKTWIYRIAVNTAINVHRVRVKELNRRLRYSDDIEQETISVTVQETMDKTSYEWLLKSMLNTLNPDQRACVVLKDMEGLSYKEIAEVLETNINTVRSRLKRARERLLAFRQKGVIRNEM